MRLINIILLSLTCGFVPIGGVYAGNVNQSSKGKKQPGNQNPALVVPFSALGSAAKLDKLKAVHLFTKVSFAKGGNVNDVTIAWSWDPVITVRLKEKMDPKIIEALKALGKIADPRKLKLAIQKFFREFKAKMKANLVAHPRRRSAFDREVYRLAKSQGVSALLHTTFRIQGKKVYCVYNGVPFLLKEKAVSYLRPLSFALSVSNLIPMKRHKFQVTRGEITSVKGSACRQYHVKDPSGTALEFFFDEDTKLLVKISHRGRYVDQTGRDADSQWDHYFSDYRETEGIKQWRMHELYRDGKHFCSLNVSKVRIHENLPAELENKLEAVEYAAHKLFKKAKDALAAGARAIARVTFQSVIAEYPRTEAAKEAKKLLQEIRKSKSR